MKRLAIVLLLAGCVPDEDAYYDAPTPSQRAECAAQGGEIVQAGLLPWVCQLTHDDGGQMCTRSTDCTSVCYVEPDTGQGRCSATSPVFGCFEMLDETGAQVSICVD